MNIFQVGLILISGYFKCKQEEATLSLINAWQDKEESTLPQMHFHVRCIDTKCSYLNVRCESVPGGRAEPRVGERVGVYMSEFHSVTSEEQPRVI